MDKMNELIARLRREIKSCQMDIAGGNEMNVLDALDSVDEIEKLIVSKQSEHEANVSTCIHFCDC